MGASWLSFGSFAAFLFFFEKERKEMIDFW